MTDYFEILFFLIECTLFNNKFFWRISLNCDVFHRGVSVRGVSVQGGLFPAISVKRGFCPGRSLSRRSLLGGGDLCQGRISVQVDTLFWTSGDVCHGFQSKVDRLTWVFYCLDTMDSSDSPLVRHLLAFGGPHSSYANFDPSTCSHTNIGGGGGLESVIERIAASQPVTRQKLNALCWPAWLNTFLTNTAVIQQRLLFLKIIKNYFMVLLNTLL